MQRPVRAALWCSIGIAAVAVIALTVGLAAYLGANETNPETHLKYLLFFLDGYKAIGIGLIVAVLGIVIPHLLPEARYVAERSKESRAAYSEAKTSIIYLPAKLADRSYADAVALVEQAHKYLHLAESYEELKQYLVPYNDPATWGEKRFRELQAVTNLLKQQAEYWSTLSPSQRIAKVEAAMQKAAG